MIYLAFLKIILYLHIVVNAVIYVEDELINDGDLVAVVCAAKLPFKPDQVTLFIK